MCILFTIIVLVLRFIVVQLDELVNLETSFIWRSPYVNIGESVLLRKGIV